MGLYIPNAKMPKTCYDECPCQGIHWCNVLKEITEPMTGKRLKGCPLISVQDHGHLIDAVELLETVAATDWGNYLVPAALITIISKMPIIVPADPEYK